MISKILSKVKSKRSLRLILYIVICLAGILPTVILTFIFIKSYESQAVSAKIKMVQNQCLIQANHLYSSRYLDNNSNKDIIDSELEQLSLLYDGRVMVIDSDYRIIRDTYSLSEGKYIIAQEVHEAFSGQSLATYDKDERYIEVVTPIGDREGKEIIGVLFTGISTDEIAITLSKLNRISGIVNLAVITIIIGIAIGITRLLVKPLSELSDTIDNIKEGFETEVIPDSPYIEMQHLQEAFSHLFNRMKNLDESRSEFVSNVSHELKTPITSVKVLAESLISQNDVPVEIYREFMEDIAVEVDREDKIINDLLSLVKMDKSGTNLSIEKVDIDLMLEEIIKRLTPIAQKSGVELIFETVRPVVAEVDPTKLSLAFTNIIENGIKYNREGGSVKIILDAEPFMFTVTVSDTGIGIPSDDLPNVFERFYRVDKSHSREIGGTGLGLSIARGAVIMHKGAIKVDSEPNVGTVFTVRIPISYVANKEDTVS